MKKIVNFISIALLAAVPQFASASTSTGNIQAIRVNSCTVSSDTNCVRISIRMGTATTCPSGWYTFEYVNSLGKTWAAALLNAQALGNPVTIGGDGVCQEGQYEGVYYVDTL